MLKETWLSWQFDKEMGRDVLPHALWLLLSQRSKILPVNARSKYRLDLLEGRGLVLLPYAWPGHAA